MFQLFFDSTYTHPNSRRSPLAAAILNKPFYVRRNCLIPERKRAGIPPPQPLVKLTPIMTKKEAYTHLQDFNNPYFKILPCQAGDREGFTIQSTIEPAYSINTIFEGIHFIIQTSKFYFIIMCYGQVRAIHKTLNFYTLYLPQMDARTIIANPYTDPDSGSERKFAWHDNRLSFGADYRSYIPYFWHTTVVSFWETQG